MIEYNVNIDTKKLKTKFDDWKYKLPELRKRILNTFGEKIIGDIQKNKLSGQVLNVISGDLRSSMHYKLNGSESVDMGNIYNAVKYAKYHEFGTDDGRLRPRFYARNTINEFLESKAEKLANIITDNFINEEWGK